MHTQLKTSREALSLLRQTLRGPIHKVISYAELVAEQDIEEPNSEIKLGISRLLNMCETTLQQIRQCTNPLAFNQFHTDEAALEATRITLLDCSEKILHMSEQLSRLAECEPGEAIRTDIRRLATSAATFESILKAIALPEQNSLPQGKPLASAPRPFVAEIGNELLIADVEYRGLLLVVDDDEGNRDVLSRRLLRDGYEVMLAESGRQALRMLDRYSFDLVLLDIMMPEMDGTSVLAEIKQVPKLNQLPVIMVTAVDEVETIASCLEMGADDYLLKPFNPVLLRARINALLERKRLQDEQKRQRKELEAILEESSKQKEKAEQLLLNILPLSVAQELKEFGSVQPMYFEDVTIVFADLVGFTLSTEQLPADELVAALNEHFTTCDQIVSRYGLEKMKTIGDCYMFAGGIPTRNPSHPVDSVLAAVEMAQSMQALSERNKVNWQLRIGIHTGSVIAGVVGIHKFAFDIWGDAVNFSSRVESSGTTGRVTLSSTTFARVKDFFACEKKDKVKIKEGTEVDMYLVNGIALRLLEQAKVSGLNAFQARYSTYFRKAVPTLPDFLFNPSAKA